MFAPNINDTYNKLTDSYSSVISLDGFSMTVIELQIVTLENDPDWLPAVRKELDMLKNVANSWQIQRPDILAPVILAFSQYVSTFGSIPNNGKNLSKDEWISLLDNALIPSIKKSKSMIVDAQKELEDKRAAFSSILPLIDESIAKGWTELGKEEEQMQDLAVKLGALSAQASALGSKLSSDAISENKTILTNSVKLLYAAGAAGVEASIPILGIALAVITIGKGFYDLAKDSKELEKDMREITKVQNELSKDAVALALTKGTLQVLYNLEKQYLVTKDAFPALIDIFENELTKLLDASSALKAGADPEKYTNIESFWVAQNNWNKIEQFAQKLINVDQKVALPVILDIGKAEVEQSKIQ